MKADKLIRSRRVNAKNVEREREFEVLREPIGHVVSLQFDLR